MEEGQNIQSAGTASFLLGIIGIIVLFLFSYLIGAVLGIFALILSIKPLKHGDRYGLYGLILGLICIIIGALAMFTYVYVSTMPY